MPAGTVQAAKKVSQDPEGEPDKGAAESHSRQMRADFPSESLAAE